MVEHVSPEECHGGSGGRLLIAYLLRSDVRGSRMAQVKAFPVAKNGKDLGDMTQEIIDNQPIDLIDIHSVGASDGLHQRVTTHRRWK